jgi:hypothetical protein
MAAIFIKHNCLLGGTAVQKKKTATEKCSI